MGTFQDTTALAVAGFALLEVVLQPRGEERLQQ